MDRRVVIGLVTVAALAALFFVFRPDDDDDETAASATTQTGGLTTPELEPVEPTTTAETQTDTAPRAIAWRIDATDDRLDRLRVPVDSVLALTVVADTSDHVHVHGYDLMRDVAPGRPARIRFETRTTGRFEIELEDAGQLIAQLTVVP